MDHDATREQLELAALEPGGLDRLMAGDTAAARAVVAHLAGCTSCLDESVRLQRASGLIQRVVRALPPPELRGRTLAAVAAMGVARPGIAPAPATAATPASHRTAPWPVLGWIATIAAAVVLSVVTTSLIVGARVDQQLADHVETVAALEEVTTATLAITAQPDAQHVPLTGTSDPGPGGSLAFSPSTSQLVVVATGLTEPPAGQEYRCWVEIDGTRRRVGKMFFSADLAYWAGPAPAVAGLGSPATFGVSLAEVGATGLGTDPVMVGQL